MSVLLANLDFSILWRPSPEGGTNNLTYLLQGLGWTLLLAFSSWVLAFLLGSLVGVARTLPGRFVSAAAGAYVEVFRNVPLLVQLFIWYFVIPELVGGFGIWFKQDVPPVWQQFVSGMLCLGFFTSARIAEQVRAGVQGIGSEQQRAGLALGLRNWQVYWLVLLPVAYRVLVPTLTSEFLNLIKNTAVASTIGLLELAQRSKTMGEFTARLYESFLVVTLLYAMVNLVVMLIARSIENSARLPGSMGSRK